MTGKVPVESSASQLKLFVLFSQGSVETDIR